MQYNYHKWECEKFIFLLTVTIIWVIIVCSSSTRWFAADTYVTLNACPFNPITMSVIDVHLFVCQWAVSAGLPCNSYVPYASYNYSVRLELNTDIVFWTILKFIGKKLLKTRRVILALSNLLTAMLFRGVNPQIVNSKECGC